MRSSSWEFSKAGGRRKGFNNPMLQHFDGSNYFLAREIIQNSIDARDDKTKPVEVEFDLDFIEKSNFPGHDQLLDVMQCCNDSWPKEKYHALHVFFENAQEQLGRSKIPVLRISDYNTKGLDGDDFDPAGVWFSLVQSEGASNKESGEGGSFGIGKGAPIMASSIRTVFYLTVNKRQRMIFQGVSELVNYKKAGTEFDGCGFYGYEGQRSIRDAKEIAHIFWNKRKTRTGLDVFIMGFESDQDWEEELIKSVLRNFWYGIFKNELKITVGNSTIDHSNLENYLTRFFVAERYSDDVEPIGNPLQYYFAINRGRCFTENLKELGNVSFYFLETEEYLNHVAMMRKSHMVIFSRLFRFPGNYCGVFVCDDKEGNEKLRKMEPPAHDKWVPERNPEQGKKIFGELTLFIRRCLEQSKSRKIAELLEVPEMYRYLPDNEEGEPGDGYGEKDYSGNESAEESAQTIQKKEVFETPAIISPTRIAVINKREPGDDEPPPTPHEKTDKPRVKRRRKREEEKMHMRIYNSRKTKDGYEYTVILCSPKASRYDIRFYSIGEDLMDKLNLKEISLINGNRHHFSGNSIKRVRLEEGISTRFTITVQSKFKNALKLELDEVQ